MYTGTSSYYVSRQKLELIPISAFFGCKSFNTKTKYRIEGGESILSSGIHNTQRLKCSVRRLQSSSHSALLTAFAAPTMETRRASVRTSSAATPKPGNVAIQRTIADQIVMREIAFRGFMQLLPAFPQESLVLDLTLFRVVTKMLEFWEVMIPV